MHAFINDKRPVNGPKSRRNLGILFTSLVGRDMRHYSSTRNPVCENNMKHRFLIPLSALFLLNLQPARGQDDAVIIDRKLIEAAKTSEAMKNLSYLCDEIGPRLTGSKNLQCANEWAAKKMTEYGLTNVKQEPWELPEGWERGPASAKLIEPNSGVRSSVASYGWYPGTKGKIEADVVVLKASSVKDLNEYKGKLKGCVVLARRRPSWFPKRNSTSPARLRAGLRWANSRALARSKNSGSTCARFQVFSPAKVSLPCWSIRPSTTACW